MWSSVSIIGYGQVGSSIGLLCEKNNMKFNVCDKQVKLGNFNYFKNIKDIVISSESKNTNNFYYITVPTSVVGKVLEELNNFVTKPENTYIIIKPSSLICSNWKFL